MEGKIATTGETGKKSYVIIVVTFISFLVFPLVFSWALYTRERSAELSTVKDREMAIMNNERTHIGVIFDDIINLVMVASEFDKLKQYATTGDEASKKMIETEYLRLSEFFRVYDQIRYIDKNGQEKVRANAGLNNKSYLVGEKDLQNKGDRYYFGKTMSLNSGEIYVSPIDLNVEGTEIEIPHKPIIRIATPLIFDGKNNGIFIVNYMADKLFYSIKNDISVKDTKLSILNQNSYWFVNPDNQEKEWAFMFPDKTDINMAKENPDLWKRLTANDSVQFVADSGLYTAVKFYPFLEAQKLMGNKNSIASSNFRLLSPEKFYWVVVSFLPDSILYQSSKNTLAGLFRMNGAIILTLIILGAMLLNFAKKRLSAEKKTYDINKVLQLITKILRHDLANKFTATRYCLEAFEKSHNPEKISDAKLSIEQGVDIIVKMRSLEGAIIEEAPLVKIGIKGVVLDIAKGFNIPINIKGNEFAAVDDALAVVFENLFENAIKHGGATQINVSINRIKGLCEIKVEDNGSGIPEKIKHYIFNKDFSYGSHAGSGLGLYIVKETISRYGGTVSVEKSSLGGAAFIMNIPA